MTARIIYVGGIRGTGKTIFCLNLAPNAEVVFVPGHTPPWKISDVIEGEQVWPKELMPNMSHRLHNFDQKNKYRSMLGIPDSATIARVSGDSIIGHCSSMSKSDRIELTKSIKLDLLDKFDYVVFDMWPGEKPNSDERIVALAAPWQVIEERSKTYAWGGRAPFDRGLFQEAARRILCCNGRLWSSGDYQSDAFWWDDGWVDMKSWVKDKIDSLAPWYQYFVIGGQEVGSKGGLNGEGKWNAIREHLLESIDGLKILDIGSNAGYHSFSAAKEGANVTAIESSKLAIAQYKLVVMAGEYPVDVTDRINIIKDAAQCVDLSMDAYDIAIMSAIHYHINRAGLHPYREIRKDISANHELNAPLQVVWEDLLEGCKLLIVVTNVDNFHNLGFDEAWPDWIANTLDSLGYRGRSDRSDPPGYHHWPAIRHHEGYGKSSIIAACGRGNWERPSQITPRVSPVPNKLTLMLGWRCNAKCIQCWQHLRREKGILKKLELSVSDIRMLLTRYGSDELRSLEICSFGEPMLHPGFSEIVEMLKDKKWDAINIITNGSLIDRFPEICDFPGMLTISIDAPVAELYESIRVGLKFDKVWKNVTMIASRNNHKNRSVGINMVIFERNVFYLYKMAQMANEIGINYLSVLRGEGMEGTEAESEELGAGDERVISQIKRIREEIPGFKLNDYFTPTGAS